MPFQLLGLNEKEFDLIKVVKSNNTPIRHSPQQKVLPGGTHLCTNVYQNKKFSLNFENVYTVQITDFFGTH